MGAPTVTEFWTSALVLWIAVGVLGLAAVTALVVVLMPGPARLPLARRRPGDALKGASPLESVANATTGTIEKLLKGRGSNASTLLERAGVKQPLKDVVVLVGAGMVTAGAIGLLLGGVWLGLLFAGLVPVLARVVLGIMVGRRQAAFADQLDETLQIIAGSLRAGYSLPQAVSTVSIEAEVPTSEEFARVVNETRVGRSMDEALEDASVRVNSEDFFWVTQAIAINREVGGNLADVLDGVGHTIRQRGQLKRQVKSLSAEGRLSAIILGILPFFMFTLLLLINRPYVMLLFSTGAGIVMVIGGSLLLLVGLFWLHKTVQLRF